MPQRGGLLSPNDRLLVIINFHGSFAFSGEVDQIQKLSAGNFLLSVACMPIINSQSCCRVYVCQLAHGEKRVPLESGLIAGYTPNLEIGVSSDNIFQGNFAVVKRQKTDTGIT